MKGSGILKKNLFPLVLTLGMIGTASMLVGCDNSNHKSSSSWSSKPYNRYQNQQRREQETAQKRYQEMKRQQELEALRRSLEHQRLNPQPVTTTGHTGTPRNNYAELWDECEYYSELLEENEIDHDDMSYPMDYHDLEDLRDDYESLLEENEIDY